MHQRFGAAAPLKIGQIVLLKNHKVQTGLSKKLHMQKIGPYNIIETPTDVTYKIKNQETGEEIISHRNNLLPFKSKILVLGGLVDKYYKRPHIPPPLTDNIENEPPSSKVVRFSSPEPQSQTFNSQDEPVVIESDITDYFDSSPSRSPNLQINSEPLQTISPDNQQTTRPSNSLNTQPEITNQRSSRLRRQPRKDYRTFLKEKHISNTYQASDSDESD